MSVITIISRLKGASRLADRPIRWISAERGFWLALLLLHGMAIPSMWVGLRAPADVSELLVLIVRSTGLVLSACFFVLKMAGVPWLRLRPGWRSTVAAVAIIALMHVGVVDRALAETHPIDASGLGLVLFVGSLWHVERTWRLVRLRLAILSPARLLRKPHSFGAFQRLVKAVPRPQELFLLPFYTGPRAPPVM